MQLERSSPAFPDLSQLERTLRRADGFIATFVTVPSRSGGAWVIDALHRIARRSDRRLVLRLDRVQHVEPGSLLAVHLDGKTPTERRRQAHTLNLARDACVRLGLGLVVVLLDGDLSAFAEAAPDLWSGRTQVLQSVRLSAPAPVRRRALPDDGTHAIHPRLLERCALVSLEGIQFESEQGRALPRVELSALYQPLDAMGPPPPDNANVDPPQGEAVGLLTRYAMALLTGEAGSGKSTVLKLLARRLAGLGREVVLVSLAGFEAEIGPGDLVAALDRLCAECPWGPRPENRPWLLLDGLDELTDGGRRLALTLAVDDLVRAGMAEGAILSVRPEVIREAPRPGEVSPFEALNRVALRGLSDAQIRSYVELWVELTVPEGEQAKHRDAILTYLGLLDGSTGGQTRVRALCRRPLFLAAVGVLAYGRGADLHGELAILSAFVDALIHRRRAERALEYTADDLKQIAREVAWQLYSAGTYRATPEQVLAGAARLDASALRALRLGTGLLVDSGSRVQFVHAALQDVLAAQALPDRVDVRQPDVLAGHLLPIYAPAQFARLVGEWLAANMAGVLADFLERNLEAARQDPWYGIHTAGGVLGVLASLGEPLPWALRGLDARLRTFYRDIHRAPDPIDEGWDDWLRLEAVLGSADARDPVLEEVDFIQVCDDWCLARWPVTCRQYQAFIEAGGYAEPRWWTSAGWKWRRTPATRSKDAPDRWDGRLPFGRAVTGLSIHEAAAYANWSRETRGMPIALPPRDVWLRCAGHGAVGARKGFGLSQFGAFVGAQRHRASADGVEDLTGVVRQWLAPELGISEHWAGTWFGDEPVPPARSYRSRTRGGRRWYHPFGIRLARRAV